MLPTKTEAYGLSSSPPHAHKISYTPLSIKLSFIISLSFHVSILLLVESATCAPVTKKQAKTTTEQRIAKVMEVKELFYRLFDFHFGGL